MSAKDAYHTIADDLATTQGADIGAMFGKPCVKFGGKAFVAFQNDEMIFKLDGTSHSAALALPGAHLWDPSGKGRPMKEWICLPAQHQTKWITFATKALAKLRR